MMHTFIVNVDWKDAPHAQMTGKDIPALDVNAPAELGGPGGVWSPEDLFVSSIASCLMLTLMYFTEKMKITLDSYGSTAEGTLDKGPKGMYFSQVDVKAKVKVANSDDIEKVKKLEERAEKYCLVSNSIQCPVHFTLEVK